MQVCRAGVGGDGAAPADVCVLEERGNRIMQGASESTRGLSLLMRED